MIYRKFQPHKITKSHQHLRHVACNIPELDQSAEKSLFVGKDMSEVHHVKRQVTGPKQTLFGEELPLRWVIIGEVAWDHFIHQELSK